MKFRVVAYTTDYTMGPVELGKEIMAHELQALFVTEHSHIPVKRETPWGGLQHADQAPTDDPMWMPDWYGTPWSRSSLSRQPQQRHPAWWWEPALA